MKKLKLKKTTATTKKKSETENGHEDYFAQLAAETEDEDNQFRDGMDDKIAEVMTAVEAELRKAGKKHGPMRSCHEGYAVLLEEVDELWDEVKLKTKMRRPVLMREEAIQVSAMAARFVVDLL